MKSPVSGWSDSKLKSWIISLLRRGTMRYPPRNEVLNKSKTIKKKNPKTGRMAQFYKCAKCKKDFPLKEVAVDHKIPVVDVIKGFTTWDEYIERMFCIAKNLQVLCNTCHDKKSTEEKEIRNENKRNSER